jgi:hypothetical protein
MIIADQRQVSDFERGDLVGRYIQRLQEVDCGFIEWRTEAVHAIFRRARHDGCMPVPRRTGFLVQVIQLPASPQTRLILDHEAGCSHVQSHRVGGIGLQLDCIGASLGSGIDDYQRPVE